LPTSLLPGCIDHLASQNPKAYRVYRHWKFRCAKSLTIDPAFVIDHPPFGVIAQALQR